MEYISCTILLGLREFLIWNLSENLSCDCTALEIIINRCVVLIFCSFKKVEK